MLKNKQEEPENHPLEPLQEAALLVNKQGHENTGDLLEALIQQNEKNNPEPVLEAQLSQSKKNTKEIVGAVEDLAKKLNPQEVGDGASFVVKGVKGDKGDQGEKGDKGDSPTEETLKGLIKPLIPAPIKGNDGKDGKDGKDGSEGKKGKDGLDGLDGKDGKPGRDGKDGKDGKSISEELVKKLEKNLKKSNEENLLWLNNGAVKSVNAGSANVHVNNSDPQNLIISVDGDGTGSMTAVSVASANGFAGSSDGNPATPVITLSTTVTGLLKGNGTAISAATAGTDYENPLTFSNGLTRTANDIKNELITGKAGGQTIYGGTASGESLTLSSTLHATKGKIIFGTSAYDEVNHILGIGTTSPTQAISFGGAANRKIWIENATAGVTGKDLIIAAGSAVSGTDIEGGDLILQAGLGTGISVANILFQVGLRLTTGSTLQTMTTVGTMLNNGNFGIGLVNPIARIHTSATDGASYLLGLAGTTKGMRVESNSTSLVLRGVDSTLSGSYQPLGFGGTELIFYAASGGATERMRIVANGNVSIGIGASPTAYLHIKAGTATASTSPLKFTSGTLNTTAEAGAMEYNNTPHFTNSDAVRRNIVLSDGTYTAGVVVVGGKVKMRIGGTDYNVLVE